MADNSERCERCHVYPPSLRIDAIPYMPASLRAAVNNKSYPRHGYICHDCGELFHSLCVSDFFHVTELDTVAA